MKKLYKTDKTGKTRVWYMEIDRDHYRSVSGIEGGRLTYSKWTFAEPKNVGRANATNAIQQAQLEVEAEYRKKEAQGGYGVPYFEPMLAKKYTKIKKFPVYVQSKLDGIRCIAKADGLWTRRGKPITAVPHIEEALKATFKSNPELILDGELYNHEFREDFNAISSIVRKQKEVDEQQIMQYHIYDCCIDEPFSVRYFSYAMLVQSLQSPHIKLVLATLCSSVEELDTRHGEFIEKGYEGSIIRLDGPYENKRSKNLLKRKDWIDEEFEIIDIEEGVGNRSGMAGSVIYKTKEGKVFGSGIKGGLSVNRDIWARRKELIGKKGTVCYFHLTPDGAPRFANTKDYDRND